MKALEKVRERRYSSVAEFAADIQRYIEHRPVLASPPGRLYRARKFLRRHRLAVLGTAAGLAFLLLSGVTVWSLLRRDSVSRPKLTDKDTIVLADFDNKTGDPVFDDTLRQGLSVELQQSPFLTVISDRKVQQTLALMGQPKEARLTSEMAQQICERTASAAVLEGSIASVGSHYVLGLRAMNCNTGNVLDQEQAVAATREDVLNSLSQIARKFRTRVGESLATVEKHSTPLAEATTSSLEALKAYSTGMKASYLPGMPRRYLSTGALSKSIRSSRWRTPIWGSRTVLLESPSCRPRAPLKAWELRDRVSDREKFFIDFTYDRQVTGNLEKAHQTLELWLQTYPRGGEPKSPGFTGGPFHPWDRPIRKSDRIRSRKNRGRSRHYLRVLQSCHRPSLPGPFRRSRECAAASLRTQAGDPFFARRPIQHRGLKGPQRQDGANSGSRQREAKGGTLSGKRGSSCSGSFRPLAGRTAVVQPRHGSGPARGATRGGSELPGRTSSVGSRCGNAAEGKRNAMAALALSNARDVQYAAGLALALSGDSSRSEALADDLEKRFPEDTFAKFTYVPVLRALSALERGKPTDSVEQLQIALRYELAVNGLNFGHFYLGGLHSAYVRGEALIAARRYAEAAAEFQKILDHRGLVGADPIGALAHWQLGRVFALSGDKAKAKAAYEAFLALWKDADPDIPILKSAKAEYARL